MEDMLMYKFTVRTDLLTQKELQDLRDYLADSPINIEWEVEIV